jgi:hypothetical protein
MFKSPNKNRWCLFLKASPLAKKYTLFLYCAPIIIASKNELGWFAIINNGPFVFSRYLFLILISLQNNQSATLIKNFNTCINFFINIKKPHHK